ncbi:bifunctional glutamate N-acetyltransferase/amino-acid acetyltransferase ArgJ [Alkalilimnicola sp. S0819]|uniref:bifunctional glutamate N-acetyltransferase/amino-acid acetyltransferase ArgJ n=1 Tax=Alkalilimnicola sp. S0819 TaxID=2613922 RepID=UPI0012627222|nr:bifunctional glutamate N-acetyltransferase/amino-acid acetyltransferase ArgJ [Alkalilimnicola sp. S0819]KAB7623128.1 bifunctional glutamate N-acetyltransferase/amino-acid acetyltransferase ArgJ [Alkalilimnicola sp. S0819]MPQ16972.1 bifunctional glutamate N-acetyltransferase/amino-acid acetyltransferase ArgJ [Alkalilimnicola sp. S0819]
MSEQSIHPVPGLRLGAVAAGIKKPDRRDLVVMELAPGSRVAAVFTRNRFCAAPVHVAREHLARGEPRYLLVNTGYANAGTGEQGLRDARACCAALARAGGCAPEQVLPFSTGVIGEALPVERISAGLPAVLEALAGDGWREAASGILTTDTVPKLASREFRVDGVRCILTGMAKGSGMIRPDMATMLAYVATDAALPQALLDRALREAVHLSFNRVTVDGDTSTNDACVLAATGQGELRIEEEGDAYRAFRAALTELCVELARAIARDGEGATKLVNVHVDEALNELEAARVAFTVAESPLVKTALFASDPNWGRILAAVGRAGIDDLDVSRVRIYLDELCIARDGGRAPDYQESAAAARIAGSEVTIRVCLGRGVAKGTVWTCDFSYDYVRINAEYRT